MKISLHEILQEMNNKLLSNRKIEKQAESYVKSHFQPPTELTDKIKEIEDKLVPLTKAWGNYRDKLCSGDPCVCKSLPKYSFYMNQIEPLASESQALNQKLYQLKKKMLDNKISQLHQTRAAKKTYRSTL